MADIFDSIAPDKGDIFDRITPQKEDIFDKIKGVGEGIATTALGATTWIPTGIANVADMGAAALSGQTPAFEMGKNVEHFFAYEPKTKVGKAITSAVQYPFKKLGEFQQAAGEKVYEATGSPVLAAGTETAIGAIPFVAPVAVGKGISKVKGELKSLEGMKGVVAEAKGDVSIKPEVKLDIFDKVEQQAKPEIVEPAATSQGKGDFNPISYAEGILKNNTFHDYELNGLMGKDPKYNPQGLPPEVWKQASDNIGFNKDNLVKAQDGTYYLKADRPSGETVTKPSEVEAVSAINPEVQKALQEPTPIPTKEAVATKIQTKQTLEAGLGSGDIPANTPVRLTTVDELRSIIKKEKLFVGKDAEGYDVISAQTINPETPIVGYGANNKVSAAIIFDKTHVESKGMAPNEVSISPKTPVKDLRFVIDGHEKILTFDELKNIYKEKPAKSETVAKTPELPPDAEMQPHRTAQRVESEAISKELLNREGLGEDIAKYEVEKGMMDKQAQLGVEIMDKDWNSAVKMALGEIPPPEGVRPGTMITAVSKRAMEKGDYETVYQLGTNEKSYTIAQEVAKDLKSFDQGLSDNPVTAIRSIVKARKEENAKTGVKVDTAKQNAEIERLNKALEETQKKLDEHIAQSEKKQPIKYGSTNKIVTESEYLKAKQELREKLGSQLSAGIDPTIAAQLGKIGAYHLEAGARSFAVWSERVIVDVGDWVKPHLKELYKQATETVKNTAEQTKLQRFKTRLQNETRNITGKIENLEFEKPERKPTILDAEGRRLKDIRDRAKLAYDTAVRKTGTVTREESAKLLDLARKAAELKSKYDPAKGWPSTKERLEYGRAQVAFERYVAELKEGDTSLATLARRRTAEFINTSRENPAKAVRDLAVDTLGEISDSSIALVASLDNSFIGRQGLVTLQTHPTVWAKAAMKSFSDIYKALRDKHGNEVAKDILHADLVSRENYLNGNYQQSGILAKFEEQYPTSRPSRIPVIGRAFKASEVAFTNTALRMRIGTFDLLLDMAKKEGLEIDKAFIKDIGAVVNSATARAKTHDSKFVKNILWAPKMMLANVNILTGHGLGAGLKTGFARKQAAFNLMKIVGETAAVVAVLNALKPDAVELDPRSSDFMKYRDGNTRIDLTAGRGQYITLTARWLTGQTKNAQTKIIKELNLGGFGKGTYFDVGLNFLINKTTPTVRQGISIAQGKNFEGKKPTIASTAVDLVTPIPVKNFYDNLWGDYPDKSATALIGAIADVFGVNANTYQPLAQWDNSSSKELKEFRRRVGEDRFQKANILYNNRVNAIIERVVKTSRYERLSDDDKQKLITQIRRQEKNKILGK